MHAAACGAEDSSREETSSRQSWVVRQSLHLASCKLFPLLTAAFCAVIIDVRVGSL